LTGGQDDQSKNLNVVLYLTIIFFSGIGPLLA